MLASLQMTWRHGLAANAAAIFWAPKRPRNMKRAARANISS